MSITSHIQGGNLGKRVTLFELDLSAFDLGVMRFAPGTRGDQAVYFNGELYAPHPVKATGYEMNASGPLPRPKFTAANIENTFTALVEENDDLHGAILTRIRTYAKFLDDGEDPDGSAMLPPDVFAFGRLVEQSDEQLTWECVALMDQEGVQLPNRRIIRDYCGHTTRRWTAAGYDYHNVTCPYVGAQAYDQEGQPTTPPLEKFSKRLTTCCKVRFGATAPLPTRAFPGVSRLRIR